MGMAQDIGPKRQLRILVMDDDEGVLSFVARCLTIAGHCADKAESGEAGLRKRTDEWSDAETQVVYPDAKPVVGPDGKALSPEAIPVPQGAPTEAPKGEAKPGGAAPTPPRRSGGPGSPVRWRRACGWRTA